jgi:hypothetical protein
MSASLALSSFFSRVLEEIDLIRADFEVTVRGGKEFKIEVRGDIQIKNALEIAGQHLREPYLYPHICESPFLEFLNTEQPRSVIYLDSL